MNRRDTLATLIALSAMPRMLRAQPKISVIALLWIEATRPSPYLVPLIEGLREHGYVPGRNVRIEERFLVEEYERLTEAAARLVAERPDLILVSGATAVTAARKATATIPIVMVGGGDPVKLGVVASLARPGGNVTGLTVLSGDLAGKRIELLREVLPTIKRLAVVLYPQSQAEIISLRNYEEAARAFGIEVRPVRVHASSEIGVTIAGIAKMELDAMAFVGSTLFRAYREQIVRAVGGTGLPAIYVDNFFTEVGGLLSYGPNMSDNFRRAAVYVDKILKGAKAADLPVEQPTRLELIVNLKAAKAQRVTIPRSVLLRADKVIA
jgi:putative tryptophan/tyrosine transport system substrate-binding protein